jgi:hypothetical protein
MGGFNGVFLQWRTPKTPFSIVFSMGKHYDNLGDPFILGVDDSDWSTALSL